jgi:DnaJ-class molecular chaperone
MADHYETLGVARTASADEIKTAFRKLAKEHHPDKHPGDESAKARFQEINSAYQELSDPDKRAAYDRGPAPGFNPNFGGGFRGGFGGGFGHQTGDIDFEEILRQAMRGGPHQEPQRNRDINLNYQITLEEAYSGKETEVSFKINDDLRKINLKIPAGIESGIRIRYHGGGHKDDAALPPGDLYVSVQVARHYRFMRHGPHLETSINIDYLDAMLGSEVQVPTIEGGTIALKVPAGITPGQSMRVQGKGMPIRHDVRGDMFIEVVIVAPTLSSEQKALLEQVKSLKPA